MWDTLLVLSTACPAEGHSFAFSSNCIPNYLEGCSLPSSSSDWLCLPHLLSTEMPSDCIWKVCILNMIIFLSVLPCQWISSPFLCKIMCGANIWACLWNRERVVPPSSNTWKWTDPWLLWHKYTPDNTDLFGPLICCWSQSTWSVSVPAGDMWAHFCWGINAQDKCSCGLLCSFYNCISACKPQEPQMGQIQNGNIFHPCGRRRPGC